MRQIQQDIYDDEDFEQINLTNEVNLLVEDLDSQNQGPDADQYMELVAEADEEELL